MSDLVSRSALLEELSKREYSREKHDFEILIKNQPTAYDVDAVAEQVLEITRRIFNYCEEIDNNIPVDERTGYDMLADINLLRDVVRKGDVNENNN